jgi:hypothetical protein
MSSGARAVPTRIWRRHQRSSACKFKFSRAKRGGTTAPPSQVLSPFSPKSNRPTVNIKHSNVDAPEVVWVSGKIHFYLGLRGNFLAEGAFDGPFSSRCFLLIGCSRLGCWLMDAAEAPAAIGIYGGRVSGERRGLHLSSLVFSRGSRSSRPGRQEVLTMSSVSVGSVGLGSLIEYPAVNKTTMRPSPEV